VRKNIYIAVIMGLVAISVARGQEEHKREFRSVWVASVANIDWPKKEHRDQPEAQKSDLVRMLEHFKSLNMNAVLLQVRPECDALYQSAYEPWSRYLTWTQGDDPGYDPLQFALDTAHALGIELHVWLNPYRINASTSDDGEYYHHTHIYSEHPEWAIEYASGKKILNPGIPEVVSYIGSIVRDILSSYAVDGVHFDDYFYAYEGTEAVLDADEYAAYGEGMSLGDWRRNNVNQMIDTVYHVIQDINPSIRFGVSPFGIYRNGVPPGIIGLDAYSVIYCDPLAWLRNRSVDYLTPQLYWPTGGAQDFETLVNWWSDSIYQYNRHLFPGQGTYRLSDTPGLKKLAPAEDFLHESKYYMDLNLSNMESNALKGTDDPVAPWTLEQIGVQIDMIRSNHEKSGSGSVFFSAKDFTRVTGLADYMSDNKYTHPTVMPEMIWKKEDTPGVPKNVRFQIMNEEYYLMWDFLPSGNERFAIYESDSVTDANAIILDPFNLQDISFGNGIPVSNLVLSTNSLIVVTAISATGRESIPSNPLELNVDMPLVDLVSPLDGDTVLINTQLQWDSDLTSPLYQLQISSNSSFSNIIYTSSWTSQMELSLDSMGLQGETEYFWRVRAKESVSGPYSGARSFITGYPEIPEYLSPENLAQQISTTPTFRWNATLATEQVLLQVSINRFFEPMTIEETFPAESGQGTLSLSLEKETWYYVRLAGINAYGTSEYSSFSTFKTTTGEIPHVELEYPVDQATVSSFDLLQWKTTATEGTITYQVEVSMDEAFSVLLFRSLWISEQELMVALLNMEGKRTYFWRVKGKSEFGEGEYSEARSFTTGYPTRPIITEPTHLSEGVDAKPVVGWTVDGDTDSVYVEFSEESDFINITHFETIDASPGSTQISASLKGFTWYYVHIKAENEYGRSIFSAKKYFMTGEGTDLSSHQIRDEQLQVYPNIFTEGTLRIIYNLPYEGTMVLDIIDELGRNIYHEDVPSRTGETSVEVDIEYDRFPRPGIYHIRISHNQNHTTRTIVVN